MTARLRLLAGAVVCLLVCPTLFAQDTMLRYKWTKGQDLRYRYTVQNDVNMSGLPGLDQMAMGQTMTQVFLLHVDDVGADGTATIQQKIESQRMEINSPAGPIVIDSADPTPPANPMLAGIAPLLMSSVGQSFTIVVAADGSLKSISGLDQILAKVTQSMPPEAASMGLDPKTLFSEDSIRSTFESGFSHLPDHAIKPGDSWTSTSSMNNASVGTLALTTATTFKSVDAQDGHSLAHLSGVVTGKPTGTAPPGPMGLATSLSQFSGDAETLFDVANGRLHRATSHTTLPVSMSGTGPDGNAMNVEMITKATVTMELIEK